MENMRCLLGLCEREKGKLERDEFYIFSTFSAVRKCDGYFFFCNCITFVYLLIDGWNLKCIICDRFASRSAG